MPIVVKLYLIPEEAAALRDFARISATEATARRAAGVNGITHLERGLTYLGDALANQIIRYVPETHEPKRSAK